MLTALLMIRTGAGRERVSGSVGIRVALLDGYK